jgi:acylphosphatase
MKCYHYFVSGRVQGVSFRHFTAKSANASEISGWVRNLPDGRVEILAAGVEGQLQEFEAKIARGPLLARVDKLEKESASPDQVGSGFQVLRD